MKDKVVDDVARTIVRIRLAELKFDNVRRAFDEADLIRLGESLKRRQWHPIVVRSSMLVVDGERRVRAGIMAGLETLDAIVTDEELSQTELRLAQGVTAFHRADLSGWERYQLVYELAQLNPEWQAKQLAEALAVDPTTITKIMAASHVAPEVRAALEVGKIGTSDCYAISRLKDESAQREALEAKLAGATRDYLEQQVRRRKNATVKKKVPAATRMRAALPSGIEIALAGKELDLGAVIDALGELLKLAKKAERDKLDVKTFEAVLRDQAKPAA